MQAHSVFAQKSGESHFESFIEQYCTRLGYDNLNLTQNELTQLSWYIGSTNYSPQASEKDVSDKWHIEIKRSLARCYAFNLILDGGVEAHKQFIQAQNEPKLSEQAFTRLSLVAQGLGEDVKAVIRASCFLSINERMKKDIAEAGYSLTPQVANDSEKFLSELAVFLQTHNELLPITQALTPNQIMLLVKVYWPDTHFRHLMFTEGGDNMTRSLRNGLLDKTFKPEDVILWQWRWLTNLFGFINDKGAKYYNEEAHQLAEAVFASINKVVSNPESEDNFISEYLAQRAELAGLTEKPVILEEKEFLAHLAAYFNQINIVTPEQGELIYRGYTAFKEASRDQGELASTYQAHRKDRSAITPTYIPAILNNAYIIFKEKLPEHAAIAQAVHFVCDCLVQTYAFRHDQYLSFREYSQIANLRNVIPVWQDNANNLRFDLQETGELCARTVFSLSKQLT